MIAIRSTRCYKNGTFVNNKHFSVHSPTVELLVLVLMPLECRGAWRGIEVDGVNHDCEDFYISSVKKEMAELHAHKRT